MPPYALWCWYRNSDQVGDQETTHPTTVTIFSFPLPSLCAIPVNDDILANKSIHPVK